MANETAQTQDSGNKVQRLAAQPKTSHLVKQFAGDLSKKVDLSSYETALGGITDPGIIKAMLGWENYVLRVMHAQREALRKAGKEGTLEEMVGDDYNLTHFRKVVAALCSNAAKRRHTEVQLDLLLPPKHASAMALEQALKGGAAILVKQGAITSKPPVFKTDCVGLPDFSAGGHDSKLLAAAEERVKAIIGAFTK